jgi:hypothetical protein
MKDHWNDALAAYDRECSVIEGVRTQYLDFLSVTIRDVARAVVASLGPPTSGIVVNAGYNSKREKKEPTESVAQWSNGLLDVDIWPSSPHDGPAGLFRVGLFLRPGALEGADIPPAAVLGAAASAELAELPGSAFELKAHPDAEEEDRLALRIASVPAADRDLHSKLVGLVTAYACARARIARTMLGPYGWVQLCLVGLVRAPLSGVTRGAWSPKLLDDPWAGGRYAQWVSEPENDYVWVATLPPDGRLVFGFAGRFEKNTAFHAALCTRLQSQPEILEACPCGALLDASGVREAFEGGDRDRIAEITLGALRAYFALAEVHASKA